jgi:pimeloyl-ACP methyl ester carboxylesterase
MQKLVLADGRTLAYEVFGEPAGRPVFYCHGFPGSRLEARLADRAAADLHIRLIAPDRPGFGGSTAAPQRQVHDWPQDLRALAAHLQTTDYHLLGVSGGGPYALACAVQLGVAVRGVAVVCGLGELNDSTDLQAMSRFAARSIRLYQRVPRLGEWFYGHLVSPLLKRHPELIFRIIAGHAPAADREVLSQESTRSILLASFREAFRAGGRGPARELARYTAPWLTDVTRLAVPVSVWHGEVDATVPVAMGRRHAAVIPNCRAHLIPDAGHFSLIICHMREILTELVAF